MESFNTWDEKTRTLYKHTILITIDDIAPQKVSPKLDEIVDDLGVLIEILRLLKNTIGPITFEKVADDLTKRVKSTIDAYTTFFEVIVGDFPYDVNFVEKILRNLRLQATLGKWGNKNIQREINKAASKPLPGKMEFTYTKRNKLSQALLDFGNHIWILSRVLFLILFFSFIQSDLAKTILSMGIWVKILLWMMLGIWIVRSIWKKKFSIFLSGVIVWGISLIWVYGLFPYNLLVIESLRRFIKIALWFTVIFWFPIQFLNVIKDNRASEIIVLRAIWKGVLSLFSYGIEKGLLVAILLLVIPIERLFGGSRTEQQKLAGVLDKRLYIPTAISLIIVALFVTREGLWLIGATIWIMFSITAGHSFRYFRKTYDLIEELYPNPQGKRRRCVHTSHARSGRRCTSARMVELLFVWVQVW